MRDLKLLLTSAALAVLLSGPSFADKPDVPPGQAKKLETAHIPPAQAKKTARAAPGPVAGLGLPVAAMTGGFIWWKNRRRKRKSD